MWTAVVSVLDQPRSRLACLAGWLASLAAFIGLVHLLGGPSMVDAQNELHPGWAIAHGDFACAYPPTPDLVESGPLYPLLSAPLVRLFHIGGNVAFPSGAALGRNCSLAILAEASWSYTAAALQTSLRIGFLVWIALAAGLVALLRASGRGRSGWEVLTPVVVACVPTVYACVQAAFHPEDLLCLGLLLAGIGCCIRRSWALAGACLGLAVTAQPYGLLVLVPLVVVAPRAGRARLAAWAAIAVAVVCVPVWIATDGRVLHSLDGTSVTPSGGDALVGLTVLHGLLLDVVSRFLPILGSGVLALWFRSRFGPRALESLPLVLLCGMSLGLRLAFEVNLFTYYCMAFSVMILLADVLRRRVRLTTVVWIAAATTGLDPLRSELMPQWPVWASQTILVLSGFALLASLLPSALRQGDAPRDSAASDQLAGAPSVLPVGESSLPTLARR